MTTETMHSTSQPLAERNWKSAVWQGLKCRCPNCGEGKLFGKWLKVEPSCSTCGEALHHEKAHDLPPYLTIIIVGHVVVTLLMILEAKVDLSLTAHLLIWVPLSLFMSIAIMQPVKGGVVGLQWAIGMFGFGDGKDHD